jgi:GNAT superfamily N-acetyltransferase
MKQKPGYLPELSVLQYVMTQFTIRRMVEEDSSRVSQLVRECFPEESDFYLDYYPTISRFPVVIAEQASSLLGAGATYLNSLHPHWLKIMVVVDKNFRGRGIGRQLHDEAINARVLPTSIIGTQIHCYKGETEAEGFVRAMGYKLRINCHILELDLTKRKLSPRLARKYGHLEIVPFTTLLEASETKQQLFDFLVTRYTQEHIWSPPQPKDHPDWEEIVFDGLVPKLSFALLDGKTIVAASSVVDDDPNVLEMCWQYASRDYSDEVAVLFLQHLLAHQFAAALEAGLTKAAAEMDVSVMADGTSDYSALLEWLPVERDRIWQIFQKPF